MTLNEIRPQAITLALALLPAAMGRNRLQVDALMLTAHLQGAPNTTVLGIVAAVEALPGADDIADAVSTAPEATDIEQEATPQAAASNAALAAALSA